MSEVGWEPNYNIDIKHVDGMAVHHISEALKEYEAKNTGMSEGARRCFDQIIEICGYITGIDDRD